MIGLFQQVEQNILSNFGLHWAFLLLPVSVMGLRVGKGVRTGVKVIKLEEVTCE